MKLLVDNPNLSIVVPGPCNASCKFCFWNRDAVIAPDYLERLEGVLHRLPKEFNQVTLTGGEPTLSPMLMDILRVLDRKRWKKIVLATNGSGLLNPVRLALIGIHVDHVNLSRHSDNDVSNAEVFNCTTIPSSDQLRGVVKQLWESYGVDTTINTVIDAETTPGFAMGMMAYAKNLGAKASSFRMKHGTLTPPGVESFYTRKYPVEETRECPVCATTWQTINGHQINWKRSVLEPSAEWQGIYEVVVQQDGTPTIDWAGKILLDFTSPTPLRQAGIVAPHSRPSRASNRNPGGSCSGRGTKPSGGCGSSGC